MPKGEVMKERGNKTRAAILEYLIREADLDGLVTVSRDEVAAALGISRTVVGHHIHRLVSEGLLVRDGWGGTPHYPIAAYLIREDATS